MTTPIATVIRIVDHLYAAKRPFALIGRIDEAVSKGTLKDIDVLVQEEDIPVFTVHLRARLQAENFELYNLIENDYSTQLYFWQRNTLAMVQIDLLPTLSYRGLPYLTIPLNNDTLRDVNGLPVISDRWLAVYAILRNLLWRGDLDDRYKDLITRVIERDNAFIHAQLTEILGSLNASYILDAIRDDQGIDQRRLLLAFLHNHLKGNPLLTMSRLAHHSRLLIKRFIQVPGLMVGVLGPDGSGKSSIITNLLNEQHFFPSSKYFHLFPGGLSRYGKRRKNTDTISNPHGASAHGLGLSLLKLVLWWHEYTIGYIIRLWRPLKETNLIVFDRYFHDLLVDPKRYRFGGPKWLAKVISKLIPKPELWLILDAPTEVLQARKQEVPFQETARQRKGYQELLEELQTAVIIDTSEDLNIVVNQSTKAILDYMTIRTKIRIGAR